MFFFLNNNYRGSCVCIFILKMHLFVSEESIQVPWTCSFEPQSELVRTRLFLWSDSVNIPIVYRVWHNFRQDRIWKWISFCIVCKKYFDKLHSVFHFFFFFVNFARDSWKNIWRNFWGQTRLVSTNSVSDRAITVLQISPCHRRKPTSYFRETE